jgi:hypothetical protein
VVRKFLRCSRRRARMAESNHKTCRICETRLKPRHVTGYQDSLRELRKRHLGLRIQSSNLSGRIDRFGVIGEYVSYVHYQCELAHGAAMCTEDEWSSPLLVEQAMHRESKDPYDVHWSLMPPSLRRSTFQHPRTLQPTTVAY